MALINSATAQTVSVQPRTHTYIRLPAYTLGLLFALIIAVPLHLVALDREGYGNTYYAAAVKSMLTSFHNFFFVSFDAGGFVSVDKPPLGLWIQTISARLFGFHPLSLLLPQAVAGIAAVAILYHLVARAFGIAAGVLAALTLAVMPISVVTNRNNTMDGLLVLTLLGAVWAVSIAVESGHIGPLLLGAMLVGLGFNIKMLQAYLVLPALLLMCVIGIRVPWRRWAAYLLCAGVVLLVVSLGWAVAVDLTPANQRPYVGSSGTNSAMSLALGYNGLSRLTDAFFTRFPGLRVLTIPVDLAVAPAFAPGIGNPGPLRLLNRDLAAQVGWVLPLAALGLLVAGWQVAQDTATPGRTRQQQALALWGAWLVCVGGFFSVARFFHTYYLIMLGPAIAALVGIGSAMLVRWYREGTGRGVLLPLALVAAAFAQAHILADYPAQERWLTPLVGGGCLLAAAVLAVAYMGSQLWLSVARIAWCAGFLALLAAPMTWSVISIQNGDGGAWLPQAGPRPNTFFSGGPRSGNSQNPGGFPQGRQAFPASGDGRGGFGTGGNPAGRGSGAVFGPGGSVGGALTFAGDQWNRLDPRLVAYLEAQQGNTRYLVATTSSSYASLFILATNQPALALGGYQSWDRVISPADLARMVSNSTVRFFYFSPNRAADSATGSGTRTGVNDPTVNADLQQWVQQRCTVVPPTTWNTADTSDGVRSGFAQANQLYDCAQDTAGAG